MGDTISDLVAFQPFITSTPPDQPSVNCQDITLSLDESGIAVLNTSDIVANSTDDCCALSFSSLQEHFDCENIGTNNTIVVVQDGNNNIDSCSAEVMVVDTIVPSLTCKGISITVSEGSETTIQPGQLIDTVSDNCNIIDQHLSQSTFTAQHEGSNNVVVTVTDQSGLARECITTVTVEVIPDTDSSCPTTLTIDDIPIPVGTYQAAEAIFSSGQVNSNDTVCFSAGTQISLLPGFEALPGSWFKAFIDSCQSETLLLGSPLSTTSGKDLNEFRTVPNESFSLDAYPNPFEQIIRLRLYLPKRATSVIQVFYMNGKLLNTIENNTLLEKGLHTWDPDTLNWPSGIYILVVNMPNQRLIKRLVKL